tara:strand:- start:194 stop:331 length:138 start_codon:yes stop_codon:yes gene_type:complete
MAHQSSGMVAYVTSLSPEPEKKVETKEEEFQSLEEALTGEVKDED